MRHIRIVADGPFGRAVSDQLEVLIGLAGGKVRVAHEPLGSDLASYLAGADYCVRASWRDASGEFNDFATAAQAASRPWLPVAFGHPHVRIGPVVVPGRPPCYTCFTTRALQHKDEAVSAIQEPARSPATGRRLGVSGYPPHVASISAGLALAMLGGASGDAESIRTGQVTLVDCITDVIRSCPVAAAYRCPACGSRASEEKLAEARRKRLRELAGSTGVTSQ